MYGLGRQAFLFEIRQTDQNIMYYTVYFVAIVKVSSLGCIHFSFVIFDDASPSVSDCFGNC